MKGRKRKPTAQLKAEGKKFEAYQNGRRDEPVLNPQVPPTPETLSAKAKAKYEELAPLLAEMDVVVLQDESILERYCDTWARYMAFRRGWKPGERKDGAYFKFLSELRQMECLLGMNPASRASLRREGHVKDQEKAESTRGVKRNEMFREVS